MKTFVFGLSVLLFTFNSFALEPMLLDPAIDQDYISTLGIDNPQYSDRVNMLLVGYDAPLGNARASKKYQNGNSRRKGLTSRSDVMMVISFDKINRKVDILSINRDFEPSPSCYSRAKDVVGLGSKKSGDQKINGTVVLYGRAAMIYCIRDVIRENLLNTPYANEFLSESGDFPIHYLYEAERGTDADESVVGKLFGSFLFNILSYYDLYFNIYGSYRETVDAIAGRYKVIFNGLKRRNYSAGSYQRAFNNAKFVADALGWAAYGVQQKANDDYQFVASYFSSILEEALGRSDTLESFDQSLMFFAPNGRVKDHLIRYAGYIDTGEEQPVSPVRVIQFGHTASSYAIYQNNVLDVSSSSRNDPFTRKLQIRPVLNKPEESIPLCLDCHIMPELGAGQWGKGTLQ